MPLHAERRTSVRYDCNGCIRFTQLNREKSNRADIVDLSEEGMRFQSTFELKPGSSLMIRVDSIEMDLSAIAGNIAARSLAIAEVKWCTIVEDRPESIYATGVKFFLPE